MLKSRENGSNKNLLLTLSITFSIFVASCNNLPKLPTAREIVDESLNTLHVLKARADLKLFNSQLRNAAGVAIFPSVYRAGFFVGAEGGNGILLAKNQSGTWGHPGFYSLASGSWGLQFGGQKSGIIFIIRSPGAVKSLIDHQGKISAGMDVAAGKIGTSLKGGITTNLGGDIIAYSDSKGLFSGVALEGSALIRRNDLNQQYYGQIATPEDIIINDKFENQHANNLRRTLSD